MQVEGHAEPLRLDPASGALPLVSALLPESAVTLSFIHPILSFLRAIRYYSLDEGDDPILNSRYISEEEYQSWLSRYRVGGRPGSVAVRLLHMHLEDKPLFDELASLVGEDGLDLIASIRITKHDDLPDGMISNRRGFYTLGFMVGRSPEGLAGPFSYLSLSLGTRRVLRLLTSILFDRSSVLLIEHPEDGVHRGLLRKLISLLRTYSEPAQFFVTSHSSVVLDQLRPDEVRWVAMEDGKTTVRALSGRQRDAATRFVGGESPLTMTDFINSLDLE